MKKILIVEDDKDILEVMKLVLESNGFETETKSDGKDFIKKVEEISPDAILVDMLLSGTNGSELVKELRKHHSKVNKIPVIMVSAHTTAAETALEAGANAFIAKPFDIFELVQKINQMIESK